VDRLKKKSTLPLIGPLLKKIAPRIGAVVDLEPVWKMVGQITYRNGRRRYFRLSSLDLNPMGASAVAKDKDYASHFMAKMGYPVVPGKTFFSPAHARKVAPARNIDAAWRFAQRIGLPVIVKPNSGTRGQGVALVHTKRAFYRALRTIFKKDDVALVQEMVCGKDYRLVVLDNRIISAYERTPLNVIGDGKSTIDRLLRTKQAEFRRIDRDTVIRLDDPRIVEKLRREGLTDASVVPAGQRVFLLDNANLSSGGDSLDVTKRVHPKFAKIAIALTRDMGLRLCGVDLMIDGSIDEPPKDYWVLEVNSAPGLDHYARSGAAQLKIVEDLYLQVLKSMN
jgi:D-alanine-D-alanine ligase-like ATP-grasp enzyme